MTDCMVFSIERKNLSFEYENKSDAFRFLVNIFFFFIFSKNSIPVTTDHDFLNNVSVCEANKLDMRWKVLCCSSIWKSTQEAKLIGLKKLLCLTVIYFSQPNRGLKFSTTARLVATGAGSISTIFRGWSRRWSATSPRASYPNCNWTKSTVTCRYIF